MSNLRPNFYVKEMGQSSPSAKGCGDSKDTPPVEIPEPLKIRKAKASLSLDALRFHSDPSEESTDISHSTCGGSTKTPTKKSSFTLTRYLKRRLSWSQDSKSTTDLDNDDQKPNLSDARKTIGNATPHRRGALSRMKGSFDDLVRPSGVRSPPSSHGGSMRTSAQQSPSRLSQRLRQRLSWSQDSDSTTDLDENQKPSPSYASETKSGTKPHHRGVLTRMMRSFDDLVCLSGTRSPEKTNSRVFNWKEGDRHRRSTKTLKISSPFNGRCVPEHDAVCHDDFCSVSPSFEAQLSRADPFSSPAKVPSPRDAPSTVNPLWSPASLPVTYADISVEPSKIELHEGPIRVAFNMQANVNNLDKGDEPDHHSPLDVLILVDNMGNVPRGALKGTYSNACLLGSYLTPFHDRVALCAFSLEESESTIDVLLPLMSPNLPLFVECFLRLLQKRNQKGHDNEVTASRFEAAIAEAEQLLTQFSNSSAPRELFIVSARKYIPLPSSRGNFRTRIHTIAPAEILGYKQGLSNEGLGWHIRASFLPRPSRKEAQCMRDMIKRVIRHSRMGLDSGVLTDLSVKIDYPTSPICTANIEGPSKRKLLRPGETWTILVNVKLTPAAAQLGDSMKKATLVAHPNGESNAPNLQHHSKQISLQDEEVFDTLIKECYEKLSITSNESGLSLGLTYGHSQLSHAPSTVSIQLLSEEAHCII